MENQARESWASALPPEGDTWLTLAGETLVRAMALDLAHGLGAHGAQWMWVIEHGMRALAEATQGQTVTLVGEGVRVRIAAEPLRVQAHGVPTNEETGLPAPPTMVDFERVILGLTPEQVRAAIGGTEQALGASDPSARLAAHLVFAGACLSLFPIQSLAVSGQVSQGDKRWWHGVLERV